MSSVIGLRERKKADTRRTIGRAALLLAVEHGPDAITVDDIASAADVSPRTVFNYFATKEDAIFGFDPKRSLELEQSVLARPDKESPLATLRAAFLDIATGYPEAAELARLRAQLVHDHPQLHRHYVAGYSALEHALVDAIARRTGVDPDRSSYPTLVVSTAIAAFRVALDRAGIGKQSLTSAIDEAFDALANGLRPPR
jgi:AcrR family transcriptional regulator